MSFITYKVRRRFQWNGFVYAPFGQCECSSNPGFVTPGQDIAQTHAEDVAEAYRLANAPGRSSNPCLDKRVCKGMSGTGCTCNDAGYCGSAVGKGACGIKPHMYGGDIWLVRENDFRIEHILGRRFVTYDASLPSADELMSGPNEKLYKTLALGEPSPGVIWFEPEGQIIVAPAHKDETEAEAKTPVATS